MNATEIVIREVQGDGGFQGGSFLLNALVSLVKRRICILMVRFCRSTKLVEMWSGSGSPVPTLDITSAIRGGEYLP